jgi:uncharacterized membrane protein
MQGKAAVRGHPVHLMLVSFPVAFWTGALGCDIAGGITHDPFWFRVSVVAIAAGTVIGVLAAIAGYIDYATVAMPRAARRTANGHLWWSLAAIVVFAAAWAVRAGTPGSAIGIALTASGSAIFLIGGYFGSELSARFGVGMREPS